MIFIIGFIIGGMFGLVIGGILGKRDSEGD